MKPVLSKIDHLVLTVENIDRTIQFYCDTLSMTADTFTSSDGSSRTALKFSNQKINLHLIGAEYKPHAAQPTVGSADLCFISDAPLNSWIAHLTSENISVEGGPITRTGAMGPITSIYIRDPDGNLIEISNYENLSPK